MGWYDDWKKRRAEIAADKEAKRREEAHVVELVPYTFAKLVPYSFTDTNTKTKYNPIKIEAGPEGAQEKAPGTGIYKTKTDGVTKYWNIKAAIKYPADDIAEVVTSSILTGLVGPDISISYSFVSPPFSKKDKKAPEKYTVSEVFSPADKPGKYPATIKSVLQKDDQFWLVGSDPTFESRKKNIHRILEGKDKNGKLEIFPPTENLRKKDMGKILAGCLLLGEYDIQVGNMVLYKDKNNNERVASFDHGWGLVDICADKHKKIRLFESKGMAGASRGTHGNFGLPTNHFNDYPGIILSKEFVDGLDTVINDEDNLNKKIEASFEKITDGFTKPQDQMKQFKLLAEHIGLNIDPAKHPIADGLKKHIFQQLTERLNHRTTGLKILRELINIKTQIRIEDALKTPEEKKAILEASLLKIVNLMAENSTMRINDYICKTDRETLNMAEIYENSIKLGVDPTLCASFKRLMDKERINALANSFTNIHENYFPAQTNASASPTETAELSMGSLQRVTAQQPLLKTQAANDHGKSLEMLADQIIKAVNRATKATNTDGSIVLALDSTKVSLSSSQNNSLIIKELPSSNTPNTEKNCAIIFAQSLIASGDPNPEITNGSPKKVLELLRALEKSDSPINPKIDPNIIKNTELPPNYGGLNEDERTDFKKIQEVLAKRQLEKQPTKPEDTISLHATSKKSGG